MTDVFAKLHADVAERNRIGLETYGRDLTTFDGRDSLQDAYEEAIDLAVYLAKVILERDAQ